MKKEQKTENGFEKQQLLFYTFRNLLSKLLNVRMRNVTVFHDYKANRPLLNVDKKDIKEQEKEVVLKTQELLDFSLEKLI